MNHAEFHDVAMRVRAHCCLAVLLSMSAVAADAQGLLESVQGALNTANTVSTARDNWRANKQQGGTMGALNGVLGSVNGGQGAAPGAMPGNGGQAGGGYGNGESLASVSREGAQRQVQVGNLVWQADHCAFSQSQEITCYVAVMNQGADTSGRVTPAVDVRLLSTDGTVYKGSSGGFGNNMASSSMLANGISTPVTIRFRSIDPRTSGIARLQFYSGTRSVTFENVPMGAASSGGAMASAAPAPVARTTTTSTTTSTVGTIPGNATPQQVAAAAANPTAIPGATTTSTTTTSTSTAPVATHAHSGAMSAGTMVAGASAASPAMRIQQHHAAMRAARSASAAH